MAIQKCCQVSEVFTEMCIASRTVSKCEALKEKLEGKTNTKITTAQVDADNVDELIALIEKEKTGSSAQSCTSISGSDNHGRMSCDKSTLY